jgi:hypothetical protein
MGEPRLDLRALVDIAGDDVVSLLEALADQKDTDGLLRATLALALRRALAEWVTEAHDADNGA